MPIRCPSSYILFTISSLPSIFSPTRKKVALTFLSLSPSSSFSVDCPGPSSKVKATTFSYVYTSGYPRSASAPASVSSATSAVPFHALLIYLLFSAGIHARTAITTNTTINNIFLCLLIYRAPLQLSILYYAGLILFSILFSAAGRCECCASCHSSGFFMRLSPLPQETFLTYIVQLHHIYNCMPILLL